MTPALRTPTLRTPGDSLGGLHDRPGKAASCYGQPGDVCAADGCDTILSAYTKHDRCNRCGGGRLRPPRRRGSASVGSQAATTAAPEPRRVSQEEIEMAAAKRQEASDAKKAVQAALTDEYQTAPEVAKTSGVAIANVYYHCKRLVEEGAAENKLGKGGGYRRRQEPMTIKDTAVDCQESAVDGPGDMRLATADDLLTVIAMEPKRLWSGIDIVYELNRRGIETGWPSWLLDTLHELAGKGEIVLDRSTALTRWRWPRIEDAEDAPSNPTAPAPDASPEPPADPATPSPLTPGESPAAGTCEDYCDGMHEIAGVMREGRGVGVDPSQYRAGWSQPRVGRVRIDRVGIDRVGILAAIDDLTDTERAEVLTCIKVLWGPTDVKGAGQ